LERIATDTAGETIEEISIEVNARTCVSVVVEGATDASRARGAIELCPVMLEHFSDIR